MQWIFRFDFLLLSYETMECSHQYEPFKDILHTKNWNKNTCSSQCDLPAWLFSSRLNSWLGLFLWCRVLCCNAIVSLSFTITQSTFDADVHRFRSTEIDFLFLILLVCASRSTCFVLPMNQSLPLPLSLLPLLAIVWDMLYIVYNNNKNTFQMKKARIS